MTRTIVITLAVTVPDDDARTATEIITRFEAALDGPIGLDVDGKNPHRLSYSTAVGEEA